MKTKGEIERIIGEVIKRGWRVERKRGHWRLFPADPRYTPMIVSCSPSDRYALNNIERDLKKRGVTLTAATALCLFTHGSNERLGRAAVEVPSLAHVHGVEGCPSCDVAPC